MDADLSTLPPALHDIVAVDKERSMIYIAQGHRTHPLFMTWLERIKQKSGKVYQVTVAELDEIAQMRQKGMRIEIASEEEINMAVRSEAMKQICLAARYRASDMHYVTRGTHAEIQVEINSELRMLARVSQQDGEALILSIFQGIATTRDGSFSAREIQNAQISGDVLPNETGVTSIRIVRGPSYPENKGGSFMTLRLQYATAQVTGTAANLRPLPLPRRPEGEFMLSKIGFTTRNLAKVQLLMDSPNGLIVFTGPTGSGKTTSIYEFLKELARSHPEMRQVTAEEPVEYPMDWAVQMNCGGGTTEEESGAAYHEAVRTALRMAPKTIFLGEIRGPGVAVAALNAGLTGHKVVSTLHVTDPFLFVDRMELMDKDRLNRKVFCDKNSIRGVIAQRLLPHLCPHCSIPLARADTSKLNRRLFAALRTWGPLKEVRIKGDGCPACEQRGSIGRFAVAEVVVMDDALAHDYIVHGTSIARERYRARADADPSMLEAAIQYALRGIVDPRDVEKNVDLIIPVEARAA